MIVKGMALEGVRRSAVSDDTAVGRARFDGVSAGSVRILTLELEHVLECFE